VRRLTVVHVFACGLLLGQAGPYERQKVDPEAARRGRAVYTQYCINCHGNLAKGTDDGPDLIRSPLVLHDRLGNEIGPALKRLPGHNSSLSTAQVTDLTHFLKEQVELDAHNRNPAQPPNVLTGNADAGRAYFNGAGGCAKCHSVTGDLAGVGRRFQDALDLQQRFLFPRRSKPLQVKVTPAGGPTVTGQLLRIDDFNVALRDSEGQFHDWKRTPALRVEIDDPLTAHQTLLDVYTDKDIHDVVRYLESLK
jgi:cytochrome c oxidase cbb3-type subunit III